MAKKKEGPKKKNVLVWALVILALFIFFACGISVGGDKEPIVEKEIVEVEKIVYENDPATIEELANTIDIACQMAISYEQSFVILSDMARVYNQPIHESWYEAKAEATEYLDTNCIRY